MSAGGTLGDSEAVTTLIIRAVDDISAPLATAGGELEAMDAKANHLGGSLTSMADRMAGVMTIVGAAAAGFIAFGAHAQLGMQVAENKIHSLAGATEQETQKTTALAMQLSDAYGQSAQTIVSSMYDVYSANIKGTQALELETAGAKAATATHSDLTDVMKALTTTWVDYGTSMGSAQNAVGEMNKTVELGRMQWDEYDRSISTTEPMAAKLGFTYAQLGSILVELTRHGNDAANSNQMIRNTIMASITPMRQQMEAAAGLGLKWQDLYYQKGKSLVAIFHDIYEASQKNVGSFAQFEERTGMSGERAQRMFNILQSGAGRLRELAGNSTAYNTILQTMAGQGYADVIRSQAQINAGGDSLNSVLNNAMKTTSVQLAITAQNFRNLSMVVGADFLPVINDLTRKIAPLLGDLQRLATEHPHLTEAVLGTMVAMGLLGVAIRGIDVAFMPVFGLLESLGGSFLRLRALVTENAVANVAEAVTADASAASIFGEGAAAKLAAAGFQQWAISMLSTEQLMAILDAELAETTVATAAAGAAADDAAGGFALLGIALAPEAAVILGIVAAAALLTGGFVVLYQHNTDVHNAVGSLATRLKTDFDGAVYGSTTALKGMDGELQKIQPQLSGVGDWIGHVANTVANHAPSWLTWGNTAKVGLSGMVPGGALLLGVEQGLNDLGSAHDKAVAAIKDGAGSLTDFLEKQDSKVGAMRAREITQMQQQAQQHHLMALKITDDINTIIASQHELSALQTGAGYSQGGGAAQAGLQQEASTVGATLQQALTPVFTGFSTQIAAANTTYRQGLASENQRYLTSIKNENTSFAQQYRNANEATRLKLEQTFDRFITHQQSEHDNAIASLRTSLDDSVGKIRQAMTAMTDPGAFFAQLQTSIQKLATSDLGALSLAILTGKGNVDKLSDAAVKSAAAQQHVADIVSSATARVDRSLGDFTTSASAISTTIAGNLSNAIAHWTYDIYNHTGNVERDRAAIATAEAAQTRYTKLQDELTKSTGTAAEKMKALATDAATKAQNALTALASGLMKGDPPRAIESLRLHAQDAADTAGRFAAAQTRAAAMIITGSTDAATALQGLTTTAQTHLNVELAKAADEIRLHGAVTDSTRTALIAAQQAVTSFSKAMADAQKLATSGGRETFAQQGSSLGTALTAAENALAGAMSRDSQTTGRHEAAAIRDQQAVDAHAALLATATTRVDMATGNFSDALSAISKRITGEAGNALDRLTIALFRGQEPTEHMIDAAARTATANTRLGDAATAAALLVAKATGDYATVLKDQSQTLQTRMDEATAKLTLDLQNHSDAVKADTATVQRLANEQEHAAEVSRRAADIEAQASYNAAVRAGDLATAFDDMKGIVSSEMSRSLSAVAQAFLMTGQTSQRASAAMQKAADDQEKVNLASAAATRQQTAAEITAARDAGDLGTAFQLLSQQLQSDITATVNEAAGELMQLGVILPDTVAKLQGLGASSYATATAQAQAQKIVEDAYTKAALAAGDVATAFARIASTDSSNLSTAFDGVVGYFRTGVGNIQDLTASWVTAKAAVDADTAATIRADNATGSFADAVSAIGQEISTNLGNAVGGLTELFLTGTGDFQSLVASGQAATAQQQRLTQAQWDANFAVADAATQSTMLAARFQQIQSQQSTVEGAENSVFTAYLGTIAAESTLTVDGIKSMTSAITDATSEMKAQGTLNAAIASGQTTAVNDQTGIIKALATRQSDAIAGQSKIAQDIQSGNGVALAQDRELARAQREVDTDAVNVARQQGVTNAIDSRTQITVARDALQQARDAASVNAANAAAGLRNDQDAIAIANDGLAVATAQQKLTLDGLAILNDIDSSLTGVNSYGEMIKADVASLQAAQDQQQRDQLRQANDKAYTDQLAALGEQMLAGDAASQEADQYQGDAQKQAAELALAQMQQKQAADEAQQSILQANTNAVNALNGTAQQQLGTSQQMLAALQQQLTTMTKAAFIGRLNISRADVSGMDFEQWMSGVPSASWLSSGAQ